MDRDGRTGARSRGIVLSEAGLLKLHSAQACLKLSGASRESLAEVVSLSPQTVARVWRAKIAVDRRTLERVYLGFGLELRHDDFVSKRRPRARGYEDGPPAPEPVLGAPFRTDAGAALLGRARDLEFIASRFEHGRLVTLTGPGGIGKTRLAVEAARRSRFGPGVFVGLQASGSSEEARNAILRAVADASVGCNTVAYGGAFRCIVVIDGCERHVDTCAGAVLQLLRMHEWLLIVATSRERLDVSGELEYRLSGLATPLPDLSRLDENMAEAACQLFLERARMVRPDFRVDAGVARAIASIVRRVDGNPLAIEHAAARLKMFSCSDLAKRLDRSLSILNDDVRSLPAHRPSLREVFEGSYALLSAEERRLLRRVSVFVGGWTADAAFALCPDASDIPISDKLNRLVCKSLVQIDADAGLHRYRLSAVTREYAFQKLRQGPEASDVLGRSARYLLDLAASEQRAAAHAQTHAWLARMRSERANFEAALCWLLEEDRDAPLGAELAVTLTPFWFAGGRFDEADHWLRLAEARGEQTSLMLRSRVAVALAQTALWNGSSATPNRIARTFSDVENRGLDPALYGEVLYIEAHASLARGAVAAARESLSAADRAFRTAEVPGGVCRVMLALAELELDGQALEPATRHAREALDLARQSQETFGEALALSLHALIAAARNDYALSIAGGDRARALFMSLDNRPLASIEMARTAAYRANVGRLDEARQELQRAKRIARPAGFEMIAIGEALAATLALAARPEDAVLALAAVEHLRKSLRSPRMYGGATLHAELIANLSAKCGPRFAVFWFAGLRGNVNDIIDTLIQGGQRDLTLPAPPRSAAR